MCVYYIYTHAYVYRYFTDIFLPCIRFISFNLLKMKFRSCFLWIRSDDPVKKGFPLTWWIPKQPWLFQYSVMVIHDLDDATGVPCNLGSRTYVYMVYIYTAIYSSDFLTLFRGIFVGSSRSTARPFRSWDILAWSASTASSCPTSRRPRALAALTWIIPRIVTAKEKPS